MSGRPFVVFVSPGAGFGCLVGVMRGGVLSLETPPEGPEFTDANPRLHYSWKTTKEYRTRFGYLDYSSHVTEAGLNARDAGLPVSLPAQVLQRCQFVLYPYVSPRFANTILWGIQAEALEELRSGAPHPAREEVLELAQLVETLGDAQAALSEQERECIRFGYGEGDNPNPLPEAPSEELRQCHALSCRVTAIIASLRNQEARKIRRALAALDEWLLEMSR